MRRTKTKKEKIDNIIEILDLLEKERGIKKDVILDAISESLVKACRNQLGNDNLNVVVNISRDTGEFSVAIQKTIVESVEDNALQISLEEARQKAPLAQVGDEYLEPVDSRDFSRIVTGNAKNVILQKIREEERKSQFEAYHLRENDIMTGIVQRYVGRNISIDLGKCEALLPESEMVKGEQLEINSRVRVYVKEVKDTPKGPKITVSRSVKEFVKRLFEEEVSEIYDGTVEIKAIYREAGSRTKMAVWSNDEDVDPVGACVGVNGSRVNAVVDEIGGEKVDIIRWDDNPALLIENALSPAKVIGVWADEDERSAIVIVPDQQLSLAIGCGGQNARLAAKLTNYKIDIKSESQARESGLYEELGLMDIDEEEEYEGYYEKYDDEGLYDEEGAEEADSEYYDEDDSQDGEGI